MTNEVPVLALADVDVASKALRKETKRLEQELLVAVAEARFAGASWTEIGQSLGGITRQGAWERFHYKVYLYLRTLEPATNK